MSVNTRPVGVIVLAVIVWLEAAALALTALWFAAQFFVAKPDNLAGALLILALTIAAAIWMGAAGFGLLALKPWTRAATLVWQLCQVALAAGMFQGLLVNGVAPEILLWSGFGLLVPALIAGFLLFTPKVSEAIARKRD